MTAPDKLPVTLGEAQAFLRLETGEEEAIAVGLLRSATELCEAFIGQAIIARTFVEIVAATGRWERLAPTPVRSMTAVERIDAAGNAQVMTADQYAIEIDSSGNGWVRVPAMTGFARVRVSGEAGMASEPNAVSEAIRQGILRLAAHMFSNRDGVGGEPPAAVTALWRPYRRMRLS